MGQGWLRFRSMSAEWISGKLSWDWKEGFTIPNPTPWMKTRGFPGDLRGELSSEENESPLWWIPENEIGRPGSIGKDRLSWGFSREKVPWPGQYQYPRPYIQGRSLQQIACKTRQFCQTLAGFSKARMLFRSTSLTQPTILHDIIFLGGKSGGSLHIIGAIQSGNSAIGKSSMEDFHLTAVLPKAPRSEYKVRSNCCRLTEKVHNERSVEGPAISTISVTLCFTRGFNHWQDLCHKLTVAINDIHSHHGSADIT